MKCVAHEELLAKDAYRSRAANPAHNVMGWIVVRLDTPWHSPARWLVEFSGSFHAYRFMRPHLVEVFSKAIELPLLCLHAAGRRDRSLLLERTMHPLVSAILLRFPRLDQLGVDPQLDTCTCAASAGVNHTDSRDSRARAFGANGVPLSVRMRLGIP